MATKPHMTAADYQAQIRALEAELREARQTILDLEGQLDARRTKEAERAAPAADPPAELARALGITRYEKIIENESPEQWAQRTGRA